jgi:hypothetical protein
MQYNPEDGVSLFLRDVGNRLQDYTVSLPDNHDFNILIPLYKWVFTHMQIQFRSLDSSVGIATGTRAGRSEFDSRHGKIFLYSTASRPALEPIEPRIQWVLGAISSEVKRPGREADHTSI